VLIAHEELMCVGGNGSVVDGLGGGRLPSPQLLCNRLRNSSAPCTAALGLKKWLFYYNRLTCLHLAYVLCKIKICINHLSYEN
jgi:hypothetical protein